MTKVFYSAIQTLCHPLFTHFDLRFIFLSYPSFGIKIESKINVKKIRIKERVRKKKSKSNQNKEQADGTTFDLILLSRE